MILMAFPLTVLAEESNAVRVDYANASTASTYHATLSDAMAAATEGSTLVLLQNITTSGILENVKNNITLDGNGKTWNGNSYLAELGSVNITVKNLTTNSTHGFRFHGNTQAEYTATFTNVHVTTSSGIAFKIGNGGDTYSASTIRTWHITLDGCTVTSNSADTVFYSSGCAKYDLTLKDTTVTHNKGSKDNPIVFNLFNQAGGTLTLTGNTTITSKATSATSGIIRIFEQNDKKLAAGNVYLNFGANVALNLESTAVTGESFFMMGSFYNSTYHIYLKDEGATYTMNAHVQQKGIANSAFLTEYRVDNETIYLPTRYYVNGTLLPMATDSYKTAVTFPNATQSATMTTSIAVPEIYQNAQGVKDYSVVAVVKNADGSEAGTYTTVSGAWSAATEGQTVVLLRDSYDYRANTYLAKKSANVTMDGQSKYMFASNQGREANYFMYAPVDGKTITFQNIILNVQGGFFYEPIKENNVITHNVDHSVIVLKNVHMINGNGRSFLRVTAGDTEHTVKLIDSTLDLYKCNGTIINANANMGKVNLIVDNSVVSYNVASTWDSRNNHAVTFINGGGWKINQTVLTANGDTGVTLPGTVDESGNAVTKWVVDNAVYTGTTYANATATSDVTLTPVTALFTTMDGASIRTEDPAGIRFEAWFDDSLLALDGIETGILLTLYSSDVTADTFTLTYNTAHLINQKGGQYKEEGTDNYLRVALVGIGEGSYSVQFAARAYIKLGDDVIYADFDVADNVRSMQEVATAALASPAYAGNEYLMAIANAE